MRFIDSHGYAWKKEIHTAHETKLVDVHEDEVFPEALKHLEARLSAIETRLDQMEDG